VMLRSKHQDVNPVYFLATLVPSRYRYSRPLALTTENVAVTA
jgi:hypothetical protein